MLFRSWRPVAPASSRRLPGAWSPSRPPPRVRLRSHAAGASATNTTRGLPARVPSADTRGVLRSGSPQAPLKRLSMASLSWWQAASAPRGPRPRSRTGVREQGEVSRAGRGRRDDAVPAHRPAAVPFVQNNMTEHTSLRLPWRDCFLFESHLASASHARAVPVRPSACLIGATLALPAVRGPRHALCDAWRGHRAQDMGAGRAPMRNSST